ncbi:MAG TPA: hypothetical protein VKP61_04725 [Candidatus Acidoferrum sp.]|nr:hypothetical protein [Candidatus Acidoferrum sp.]
MGAHSQRILCLALCGFSLLFPASASQKKSKHPKKEEVKIESYYGGVYLDGEGEIPNGACFRIKGRVTSADFFNLLKSYGTDDGTVFLVGTTEVSQFPDKILLSLLIRDEPCSYGLQQVRSGVYLTQQAMSSLKLSFYWKHGVDMRPAEKITVLHFSVNPIEPYAKKLATELPKRYLWSYELAVPSAGVPLTDSLVLIFRTSGGRIVARVAARL